MAARTEAALAVGVPDLWDSGKVTGDSSHLIAYAGQLLGSGERAWWRVRIWDESDTVSDWSEVAFWEMGLLHGRDWSAKWIYFPQERLASVRDGKILPPCPYFRREFAVASPIRRARIYASARGVYRLHLNGQRVGDAELAPGWTDYRRRMQYQTYDVTELLRVGNNAVGAILGDGWYAGYVGCRFRRQNYGEYPEILVQMNVELEDGSTFVIHTDTDWKAAEGPLEYSDMLVGERYDARKEHDGWDMPDYDDTTWKGAALEYTPPHAVPFVPQPDAPVRVVQDLVPHGLTRRDDGTYIVDIGQNVAGRIRLRIRGGVAGAVVQLRFAEVLQTDGSLYTDNLRRATATDTYVVRGDGASDEIYEPYFTFHGFRYVEVSGYPGDLRRDDLIARVMESETEPTGTIETGNPMVNQLISNIQWGQRGNFLSVPTDCPQRDERMGWMGDAQVFVRTAAYNRNVAAFFTKWMYDVTDAQSPQGSFPNVAPLMALDGDGAPAWGDAGVIVPWTIYLMYGDTGILERCYENMARWVAYILEGNPDGIWRERSSYNFSDWLSIDAETPPDVLGTAYLAYDCSLMARIASVLGRDADASHYRRLFDFVRSAFCREFVDSEGRIAGRTQTAYVIALHMDLLPEDLRPLAALHLVNDIRQRDGHLSTGFIGVGYLCPVLTRAGYPEVAYQLLLNETFPSWGYSIAHGATTIWERWDGWTDHKGFQDPTMNSFNHYSLGSVGEWLYRYVAGIDVEQEGAGFKHFLLRPYPDERLGFVRARFESPFGCIASEWRIEGGTFYWNVVVPPNTTATIYVPSAGAGDVVAGDEGKGTAASALRRLRQEDGWDVFAAGAGRYKFQSHYTGARELLETTSC